MMNEVKIADGQKRINMLETAIKILQEELDLNVVDTDGEYEIVATWNSSYISKRKAKILKKVLGGNKHVD